MPGVIRNIAEETAWKGLSYLATILADLLSKAEEIADVYYKTELCNKIKEVQNAKIPFAMKAQEIRDVVSKMEGQPELKEQLLSIIDDFQEAGVSAMAGIDEINRIIQKNPAINQYQKAELQKFFNRCKYELEDPMVMVMADNAFKAFDSIIKDRHLGGLVRYADGINGQKLVFYASGQNNLMTKIAQAAALECGEVQRMTEHQIKNIAVARAEDPMASSLFVLSGIPGPMAEKMVRETKYMGNLKFSMECETPDEQNVKARTYRLCCIAGDTPEERDRRYTKIVRLAAKAAYMMTGEIGKSEQNRMVHSVHETEKVMNVINSLDSETPKTGYVYNVYFDHGTAIPRSYLHITPDMLEYTDSMELGGQKSVIHASRFRNEQQFREAAESYAFAGTGTPVFLTEEEYKQISDRTKEAIAEYETAVAAGDPEMNKAWEAIETEVPKDGDFRKGGIDALTQAKLRKKSNIAIMRQALAEKPGVKPSKTVLQMMFLQDELLSHRFRTNVSELGMAESKFIQTAMQKAEEMQPDNVIRNPLSVAQGLLNEANRNAISLTDAINVLQTEVNLSTDMYISADGQPRLEGDMLKASMPEHIDAATDILEKLDIGIEPAGGSLELATLPRNGSLDMRYVQEELHAEIAEILSQPLPTVKSRFLYGLDKLRTGMKQKH